MARGYELYAGADDAAALKLLAAQEYGHLALWEGEAPHPSITFMHYVPQLATRQIWGHLANANPMLRQLERAPRVIFTVFGPAAYVPSYFSGEARGVPTSYYSWSQFTVEPELVSEPAAIAEILDVMLARFQPEGRHPPLDLADPYWQGMLGAITGLRLHIREVQSRFKYGQNKAARTRLGIVEELRRRGGPQDAIVAEQVLAHLPPGEPDAPPPA
jgi:predicted FMN-binding regulatory protein PaiB